MADNFSPHPPRRTGGPVLDIGSTEFRDPQVVWHAPSQRWVMLVVAAKERQVWFYTSSDLIGWTRVSTFGPDGSAHDNIWEVPYWVELAMAGDPAQGRWVLFVSVSGGTLWGGSGVQYFVGDFDGTRFSSDQLDTLWADHGRDFYAPIGFANLPTDQPHGRAMWLGWISNWAYASAVPTEPWRGQQSLARELDLLASLQGLRLRQRIARESLAWLPAQPALSVAHLPANQAAVRLADAALRGRQWRLHLRVATQGLRSPMGLELFKGQRTSVRGGFDPETQHFFVDRRSPSPPFDGYGERHHAARVMSGDSISLEIWIDGCTLELLADDGTVAISDLILSEPGADGMALFHGEDNATVLALEVHSVRMPESPVPA